MNTPIDVNEIVKPMRAQRDLLRNEAAQVDEQANEARSRAKWEAAKALEAGEDAAEEFEQQAALKRAYATHWDNLAAEEERRAAQPPADQPHAGPGTTLVDGQVPTP